MLVAPDAAVGGIDREQFDTGAGGHGGEPITEHRGRDAGDHRFAEAFPACAAAHGFSTNHPGVGEVEVLDRDGGDAVAVGVVHQLCDGVAQVGIATRRPAR